MWSGGAAASVPASRAELSPSWRRPPHRRRRRARRARAAAGVSAAFFNVGIFFGPPLFGHIVDRTGSYPAAWWTLAFSAAVALVLLLFVRERP